MVWEAFSSKIQVIISNLNYSSFFNWKNTLYLIGKISRRSMFDIFPHVCFYFKLHNCWEILTAGGKRKIRASIFSVVNSIIFYFSYLLLCILKCLLVGLQQSCVGVFEFSSMSFSQSLLELYGEFSSHMIVTGVGSSRVDLLIYEM